VTERWAVNGPTPGHRIGRRGWTREGLVAHAATVFSHGPARDARRAVFRTRLDASAADLEPFADPWFFAFRPPGAPVARAIGCVERCPVEAVVLLPGDACGSPGVGTGLVPDPRTLGAVRDWLAGLNLNTHCAVVAGFPVPTAAGAQVPLRLWLPQVWLVDPDPDDDDGVQVVATVDRAQPADDIADGLARALAPGSESPDPPPRPPGQPVAQVDLEGLVARLAHPSAPTKVVAAWPEPVRVPLARRLWMAQVAAQRPGAWLADVRTPFADFAVASPELLARVVAGAVESLALAGTLDGAGAVAPSLAAEHGAVADFVDHVLSTLGCAPTRTAAWHQDGPLRHRATRFVSARPSGLDTLSVAIHLHPTPALLGAPRGTALHWLTRAESVARGWYGGFAGRLCANGSGEGECAVLLRGVERTSAGDRTWAGAGLVAGCDPAVERAEIERKHAAIRQAFGVA